MALKKIIDKIKKEVKVVQGEDTKDRQYTNEHTYPDEATAREAFERAKAKLFNVNQWTKLEGINSSFQLYDNRGRRTTALVPEVGYYIKITLPASDIDNWVKIAELHVEENMAEFVVHPSEEPKELGADEEVVEHFFIKEASSTFRVLLNGRTLYAYEIGRNEGINNQGEEAGDRALLNTLVAEGGWWGGVQALQWDKLTRYLTHLDEVEEEE
ncbi:MAG: hypothetical protein LPK07_13010 [Hymenobacteraceae bacterium]|mgnify:FL=1|nr:hypothetical protein [Hymenobacteraceae bacterium]